jgi:anti-anti-sigma factor
MLVGELDLVTAHRARAAIRRAQADTRELVCDLGDVWFVDLAGLRVLLDAAAHAKLTGGHLAVTDCPPIVPRMLQLLRLEDWLDIRSAPRSAGAAHERVAIRRHVG